VQEYKMLRSKFVAFIAMMGALGNVLFALSAPLLTVTGGLVGISIDLSHVGTIIAAMLGGPLAGAVAGAIVGILPGIWFGYVVGGAGVVALLCLPIGKALTGATAGILFKTMNVLERNNKSLMAALIVLLSYIPEMLFTIMYFLVLLPQIFGLPLNVAIAICVMVIAKAWVEIAIIGTLAGALIGNNGFLEFMNKHFVPIPVLYSHGTSKTSKP